MSKRERVVPQAHEIEEGLRFDRFADSYDVDQGNHPIRSIVRERVVQIVKRHSPGFVVDVGCGTGQALIELSGHISTGIGLDVSRRMLAVAERHAAGRGCTNLRFEFGSFHDLETNHSFWAREKGPDLMMQTYALHHLPQDEKRSVLRRMANALTPSTDRALLVLGDLMFFDDPHGRESEYQTVGYDPSTDRPETVDVLAQMLEEIGFRVQICPVHPLAGVIVAVKGGERQ